MVNLFSLNINTISEFLELWLSNNFLSPKNQEIFDFYYRSYKKNFGPYLKYYYQEQTSELMDIISGIDSPNVLEIGCGCGTESIWMAMHGADVLAIDIDDKLLGVAHERKKIVNENTQKTLSCEFKKLSILELPTDKKFDVIWMEQAFHHLEPRNEVLKKLTNLVKLNGYIILSETNWWNPFIQAWLFKIRGFKTVVKTGEHLQGNERIISPFALTKILKAAGFQVQKYRYFRTLPNKSWADKLLKYEKSIPQFMKPLFTHYNLVAQKVE